MGRGGGQENQLGYNRYAWGWWNRYMGRGRGGGCRRISWDIRGMYGVGGIGIWVGVEERRISWDI